ncbi:MAG: hypothetical protein ABI887_08725, partial [Burkholderiales bacterium]
MNIYSRRRSRSLFYALVISLLFACGGGGDDAGSSSRTSTEADGAQTAQGVGTAIPPSAIPADANIKGMFSPVYDWPLIPLHAVMMPDGRILTYGSNGDGTQTGKFIYDIWDPAGGLNAGHMTLPNTTPTDLFCGTQILLPAGDQIFLGGGDNWNTTIPNATNNLGNNNSNTFSVSSNLLTP